MRRIFAVTIASVFTAAPLAAQTPFHDVSRQVNQKLVKVFGSGGFRGLVAYGTGVVVSPDGYVLTAASHLLDTPDLRVHLSDGRRCQAKVVVIEPELDAALIKIDNADNLPCFDLPAAVQAPLAKPGDWVLAFSNQFEIATRDEPVSVQRGVVAARTKLQLQRGVFDAPYQGEVYVLDAVTNNPGAAGGALTTPKGEGKLLGFEVALAKDEDPCEVYLGDYRAVDGRQLPHRVEVRFGNETYGVLAVKAYKLAAK